MILRDAVLLAATLLVALAPGARALEFINEQPEAVRIIIEKWVQILNPKSTGKFNPSADPVEFRAEFPVFLIRCTAPKDATVLFKDNVCYVNGEKVAEGQFRM